MNIKIFHFLKRLFLETLFSRWLCFRNFVAKCIWFSFCSFLVPFFSACNCLLTSQGRGAYCILNCPKWVPAGFWFCGTFFYPCLAGKYLNLWQIAGKYLNLQQIAGEYVDYHLAAEPAPAPSAPPPQLSSPHHPGSLSFACLCLCLCLCLCHITQTLFSLSPRIYSETFFL